MNLLLLVIWGKYDGLSTINMVSYRYSVGIAFFAAFCSYWYVYADFIFMI